jgi:hypothetical protein
LTRWFNQRRIVLSWSAPGGSKKEEQMRSGIVLASTLVLMTATGAQAQDWCGYAAREKALIECGYSTASECESAIGKGGMCFIDPDYALNVRHIAPRIATPGTAVKSNAGRG